MVESDIALISYSHDRKANYKSTANELYNLINNYTDQKDLKNFYNYFYKKYNLPMDVVKQTVRQHIAKSYLSKSGKFKSTLKTKNIPKSILEYGALIYALFFTKYKKKIKNYKLIIDNITSSLELKRFEKLLNLVGGDKTLCVTREIDFKENFPNYEFYIKRRFRDIDISDLLKAIFNEFFLGIWIVLKISLKTNVNLFPISLRIIHNYLSFKSLFESNKAQYIIQGKHYATEPIKNYLFKKFGGVASTSIQKNIIQLDPIFFYLDLDVLFSLGEKGCSRIPEYGGRVKTIKPIGSLFMEYQWFNKKRKIEKKYDIAVIGINTSNAYERLDSYDKFMDDYYSLYRWVAKLSLENPKYKIVVIHHASAIEDKIQDKILSGTNIEVLDKNYDSYEIAFSSKFAVTYGSTMGYELNAHNLQTYFIDPGYRCSLLPDEGEEYIDSLRITSYETFSILAEKIINKKKFFSSEKSILSNLCLESTEVSNKIYNYLFK
tara:strand:- start:12847 stop:14319 length:1473 start_codon:yes stop_codon:yes gene_type:complete